MKKSFLLLLFILVSCASKEKLFLVENGISDYSILIPTHANPVELRAGQELQHYLNEISGVKLPLHSEDTEINGHHILIGHTEAAKHLKLNETALGDDGFRIKTRGKDIFIVGGKEKGTLYGVYTFLEKYLGCRKYSPQVSLIPRQSTVRIEAIDETQIPLLNYRETLMPGAFDSSYADWHKLDSRRERNREWGMWVHTFDDLVPPGKYFAEHPEYFALNNGRRVPNTQLCLSNQEVFKVLTENLRKKMAEKPDAKYWSVSQNDTFGPCQCDSCRVLEEKYGGHSGLIIYFVNRVAKQFPDKIISTLAYQYSRQAPTRIKPEKNVNIMLCTIELNRSRPIATDERNESRRFRKDITDWGKLTNNILLWDYIVQFRNFIDPFPNLKVLQPNLQFFVKNNVKMMFEQGSSTSVSEFHELRTYIMAKLLWNPDADVDAIIDDFMQGYYGRAGKYIREYIDLMHKALKASGDSLIIYGYPYNGINSYLTPELIGRYQKMFDAAEKAVSSEPEIAERVKIARLPLQFAVLEISKRNVSPALSLFEKDGSGWKVRQEMRERLNRFVTACKKYGILRLEEHGTTPDEYKTAMESFFRTGAVSHLALGKPVRVVTPFSKKYPVGGGKALTDGLKGSDDYHCNWLGFEGNEMEAVVDLQEVKNIHSISVDFLQDYGAWIWIPQAVEFFISENGKKFVKLETVGRRSDEKKSGKFTERFRVLTSQKNARYIKVKTRSLLRCPDWHLGAGGKAWIFADEIVVK